MRYNIELVEVGWDPMENLVKTLLEELVTELVGDLLLWVVLERWAGSVGTAGRGRPLSVRGSGR